MITLKLLSTKKLQVQDNRGLYKVWHLLVELGVGRTSDHNPLGGDESLRHTKSLSESFHFRIGTKNLKIKYSHSNWRFFGIIFSYRKDMDVD